MVVAGKDCHKITSEFYRERTVTMESYIATLMYLLRAIKAH